MPLNEDLLTILACPQCKGPVQPDPEQAYLNCKTCRVGYPIRDGIPVMLAEEAVPSAEQ